MNILVINGPNINMLGIRDQSVYGCKTYQNLIDYIHEACDEFNVNVETFQSNHEGEIVDCIQAAYQKFDGIVINPAAYTHTSVAILDALAAVNINCVEVHISNIYEREEFRHKSYVSMIALKTFYGEGFLGYKKAIKYLVEEKKGEK